MLLDPFLSLNYVTIVDPKDVIPATFFAEIGRELRHRSSNTVAVLGLQKDFLGQISEFCLRFVAFYGE